MYFDKNSQNKWALDMTNIISYFFSNKYSFRILNKKKYYYINN